MRHAAFLRAINVGTHNRIKMADLRAVFEGAGLRQVTTYLQTGNVLFESDLLADEAAALIEAALIERGLRNATAMVRSRDDLTSLVASDPFGPYPAEQFTRYVTLLRHELPAGTAGKLPMPPTVLVRPREILAVMTVDRPQGVDINGGLEKKLKLQTTTRYWHVVKEVAALLAEE